MFHAKLQKLTYLEDESDEESRYQGSFSTKAKKYGHLYAYYAHTTSAMDFSNVISSAGANCFSHGTDSQENFMDVYGTQSRGPQKHSIYHQLFMIHIDYDNDTSDDEKVGTRTSTATATVSTVTSTTVSSIIQTTTVTSVVPQHIRHAYHINPIVDDRLRTWLKLLWYQQV